ncbi:TauD/TfdA dioxygenase family protein [Crenalkalicoccus roseus]|uniref:TauD/TfdA dioxygenase family protein n=1 Tax=Crenalkalicoccus roseus TaxID=1485588 RepID=UPI001081AD35|nr:TauD/TfdA family dioxygenase [Crenalkalicoccus roseus]
MPLDSTAVHYGAGVHVTPSGAALAADVTGLDFSKPLSANTMEAVKRAWADHLVLRFRGVSLTDEALMAFSRHFGTLDRAPIPAGERADPVRGYVLTISNIVVDGKPIGGLGAYESVWHTDMSYLDEPPYASFLFSVEVPPSGGDTGFCNMAVAYETLPAATKARIADLSCKHDSSRNSAGELRRGFREVEDPREAPGAVHPLVIRHPASGKICLFLGRRRNAYIPGLELVESEALLDDLWAHATQPAFCWYQQWQVGDLVMWDNFATMHRRDSFDPTTRRLLRRTQVSGVRHGRV